MNTTLGKKLVAIRQRAIKNGLRLLSEEEILKSGYTGVCPACRSCFTEHLTQSYYNSLKFNTLTGRTCRD